MLDLEIDTSYTAIIVALIFGALAIFIVLMLFVFTKRIMSNREYISSLRLSQSQKLLQSTIQTEEEVRERIGANIHDDIGPMLSLLKLQINKIELGSEDSELHQYLADSKFTIDEILKLVRSVSNELSPTILNELGLLEAIENIEHKLISLTNAKVSFVVDEKINELSKSQSIAIYRIMQESLNNVIKHASANTIKVEITLDEKHVYLEIQDNGIGLDTKLAKGGQGIKNIKARVTSFGGETNFNDQLKEGTHIQIKMKKDV